MTNLDLGVEYSPELTLDMVQKSMIYQAMVYFKGNKRHASKALGISYPTLYNLLNRYSMLDEFRVRRKKLS
jgi:DNA-binding protein Fis